MKNQKKNLTRSPLHYNGNKFSIVEQILGIFNTDGSMVEIFGGTGIVSINSDAKDIWINDIDTKLMDLLKFIKNFSKKDELQLINLTEKYKLTSDMNNCSEKRKNNGTKGYSLLNKTGYLKLRQDYNKSKDISLLFLLTNYSFNRMIRFNSNGEFNVPVGKGDFSKKQLMYTLGYKEALKNKKVKFSNKNYINILNKIDNNDFVYIDPPYLNGTAQYNSIWNIEKEIELYKNIDKLNNREVKFALSNTLFANGMLNTTLKKWLDESNYTIINLDKKYSKTSHNKKNRYDAQEILVTNIEV